MTSRNTILTLLIMLMIPAGVLGAKGGNFVPDTFDFQGTVDYIDLANGKIVVDDSVYYISSSTRVHDKKSKGNKTAALKVGQYVGFDAERSGAGRPYLYEIWVLSREWRSRHPVKDD